MGWLRAEHDSASWACTGEIWVTVAALPNPSLYPRDYRRATSPFFFFLTLFQNNIKLKEKLQKQYEVLIPFVPVRPHVNILSHLLCYIFLICTYCCCCLFTRLCLTLCNPMAGSSVHKVSQASILEWVAIFFSRGSSQPRDQTHGSCFVRQILYHWAAREVLYIYIHVCKYLNFPEPFEKVAQSKPFYPEILECVFPKNKDFLSPTHNSVIKIKKWVLI